MMDATEMLVVAATSLVPSPLHVFPHLHGVQI